MLFLTHLLSGLLVGKLVGGSMILIAVGAVIVDIDHLYNFIKKGILFSPRKLWTTMFSPHDPHGTNRTIAHSLLAWALATIAMVSINKQYGAMLSIGYLSHLVIDAFDSDDLHLFFPLKGSVKGPIVYNSASEYFLNIILAAALVMSLYLI